MFPKLFLGANVKYKKNVHFYTGKEITVSYDKPTALQIDGEVIENVSTYTVRIKLFKRFFGVFFQLSAHFWLYILFRLKTKGSKIKKKEAAVWSTC